MGGGVGLGEGFDVGGDVEPGVEVAGGVEPALVGVALGVAPAAGTGAVRRDLKPAEVGPFIRAALLAAPPGQWRRYLDVMLDGLRA